MFKLSIIVTLLVAACVANAQLTPGPSSGGGNGGGGKPSSDPDRPGQYQPPEPSRPEPYRPEPTPVPPEPSRPEPYRPEPTPAPEPYRPEPTRPEPSYPEPYRPEPTYPSYPSEPSYPTYPTYPSEPTSPSYPSEPSYPSYPTYPSEPPSYEPPVSSYDRVILKLRLNRSVSNEKVSLKLGSALSPRYSGWTVTSVRANTRPNSPYETVARLITAEDRVFAKQVNPGHHIDLIPEARLAAGSQEVYLWIKGGTFVETIEIELSK